MSNSKMACADFFRNSMKIILSKFHMFGADLWGLLVSIRNNPERGTEGLSIPDYQIDAPFAVKNMLDKDNATSSGTMPCLIVAPTGSGKTGIIVLLPYILQSLKVLILTPSAIISYQIAEAFGCRQDRKNCFLLDSKLCPNAEDVGRFLEDVKVISKSADAIEQAMGNLVVVNAQKFGGRSKATLNMKYRDQVTIPNVEAFFAQFDTLIVDEAHHYPAATWKKIVEEFSKIPKGLTKKKIVFLTATPYRIDGKLGKVCVVEKDRVAFTVTKEMCIGSSIRKVVFDINGTNHQNYKHQIFDYLQMQQQKEPRYQPQAMVLVKGRFEAFKTVDELNKAFGVTFAVAISGETKKIAQNLKEFTEGRYRVAVTCKVGLEGYNNSNVTLCVILRRIVTGKIMFSQFVGRCMRIRRGLEKINGEEVTDRNVGVVLSYKRYEQEKLMTEHENMDGMIAVEDPGNEDVDE